MDRAWTTTFEIAWGDCDDAGIVFYPHYFRWMDTAFHRFLRARGTSHRTIIERYGVIGLAIGEAHARFTAPMSYDQELTMSLYVAEWRRSTFKIEYHGRAHDGVPVFEGYETRAFATRDPVTGVLKGADIPGDFKALLS